MDSRSYTWKVASAAPAETCRRLLAALSVFSILVLVPLVFAGNAMAQGCGGMGGHGGQGGGHDASNDHASMTSDVLPVWNSILFSYAGLNQAVAMMSVPDAVYYGGLMRDDFKSLQVSANDMSLGMNEPLESANNRVKQLTKQIPKSLKAGDQASAVASLGHLDTELERVIAFFPSTTFPADFESRFRGTDSLGTEEMDETAEIATPPSATTYACPMHSEVTASRPGNCPKCGMALEKVR